MLSGNIFDYMDWRGDLTFEQAAPNEVDGLILSLISYADFEDIVPAGMDEWITVEDAVKKYFEIKDIEKEKQYRSLARISPVLLEKVAECKRFKELRLTHYINLIDVNKQEQFCALTILLDRRSVFISYGGTDDSLVGWKEDFNMCFLKEIPAQKDALNYLEQTAGAFKGKIYLGGHSKGGNLAVYSAMNCMYSVKRRIDTVFDNDGPGFGESVINSDRYKMISKKIRKIVPQSSVVGMLFNHKEEYTVVYSSESALYQHDATTWEVIGDHFVYMDGLSNIGSVMDKTVSVWLESLDEDTRMKNVETIFGALESAGVNTLTDMTRDSMKLAYSLISSYGSFDTDTRKMLGNTIKELFNAAKTVNHQEREFKTSRRFIEFKKPEINPHQ